MIGIELEKGKIWLKDGCFLKEIREYFVIDLPDGRKAGTKAVTQKEAVERIKQTMKEVA